MDNDNQKLYTKDVLNLIFSNQDIDQLIPYLSKNVKAMGLYTEDVLKYNDIINHIKTYKSNHFTFYIDQFTCTVIYQNNSVCITEGVFYLNMEEYQTRTKYFYIIVFKDHQIELLHTSIGNTPKDLILLHVLLNQMNSFQLLILMIIYQNFYYMITKKNF